MEEKGKNKTHRGVTSSEINRETTEICQWAALLCQNPSIVEELFYRACRWRKNQRHDQ